VGWQQRLKEEEEEEKYRREVEEGPLLEGKKKKGKSSKGGRRSIGLKLMDVSGFFLFWKVSKIWRVIRISWRAALYISIINVYTTQQRYSSF
jgi:uncharacterized membrane protein